jgi:hypothetical protein
MFLLADRETFSQPERRAGRKARTRSGKKELEA